MTCRSPLALKTTLLCLAIGVIAGCARSSELTVLPAEATPKSPTEKEVYDVPLPSATAHLTASPSASPAAKPTVTQVAPEGCADMLLCVYPDAWAAVASSAPFSILRQCSLTDPFRRGIIFTELNVQGLRHECV